ncbi:DNA mismatch repair endonuclease MutL [Clostridium massiliamazoniense]|uniref:DNA mismatch repair endonuclease MutL n=1 Tax=Clostridium massiliamazoniense TaxID=1347366 RepID=UPI0006D7894B|nr:DNA mismatch repair endonuclease MutL [Clostridium massiliamazoniense]
MGKINILDQNTANQIAAGEVVERPSSVVKELVENSIDANSSNITIEILDGGTSLIKIIDDGNGIEPDDLKKAFMPHATSKIKNISDIYSINSMGFRGEALASIASVSKVSLKSKVAHEEEGREISLEAGNIIYDGEVGINNGTIIEVRDLFFNVPARKKFLKSTSRETAIISDIINRIALANPNISFKLFSNNKKVLHTYGNGNLVDTIRSVYNKETSSNLIEFEKHLDTITVYGFIGNKELARKSRSNQSIFVNKRYIKDRAINVAVENAYRSFNTSDKFPFFILFIEIYPELVDVNVHPTKSEIKFSNEREVFSAVYSAVHKAFGDYVKDEFNVENDIFVDDYKEKEEVNQLTFENKINELTKLEDEYKSIDENFRNNPELKKKIVSIPVDLNKIDNIDYNSNNFDNNNLEVEESVAEEKKDYDENNTKNIKNNNDQISNIEPKIPKLNIIGQFNKTYILAEYNDNLYLIDQHAAHEKLLFENYINSIENADLIIQPLIVPIVLELSLNDYGYYEENKDLFENAGFKIESFGMSSIKITEVPYFLNKLDPKNLLLSIIDNLKALGSGKTVEVKYNKIATLACKAAVKANDILSIAEMEKLLEDMRYMDDPFHCPHGRPTIIKFSRYELDKKFKRIL